MKTVLRVAYILSSIVLLNKNAIADSTQLGPERLTFNESGKFETFKSKAAKDLMLAEEYQLYETALQRVDCMKAKQLLTKAFFREYTQYRPINVADGCKHETAEDCLAWNSYATRMFNDYNLCAISEDLRYSRQQIRKAGDALPAFQLKEPPEQARNDNAADITLKLALKSLIRLSKKGHVPAIEKLATLMEEKTLFKVTTDAEYYVLRITCEATDGCESLEKRIEGLRTEIGEYRTGYLDAIADMDPTYRPKLSDILSGKKLPTSK